MKLREYIKENILFLDGGMGTLLQAQGLQPGEFPERWNLSHPEVIEGISRQYYDAGSNVVSANTFGANSLKFSPDELKSVIRGATDAVKRAKAASHGGQEKFIALDIGPTGRLLKPYGDLDFEEAVRIFSETVRIGAECGVDLILIETMNDSYETKAALLAAKENSDLPVFVTNAYGADGKLMTGATPTAMAAMLEGMGADAIGANCSLGPRQLMPVIEELLSCASVPVILKPNAGLPAVRDGETFYDVSAREFAADVLCAVKDGVQIVGGCCGTTPEYISTLKKEITPYQYRPFVPRGGEKTLISSYTKAVYFGDSPVLIGERINPTGKKRFRQALKENDIDYILQEGLSQQEHGAQVLDVNVGLPDIDEREMLKRTVCELQAVCDLPLQIDTSDPCAMEAALRVYNGKAMVNSVNGKKESMEAVFPLVKKYGGLVVALTLDENGIPETAEGRYEIAKRILNCAADYGIAKKDLIFDPLAMTVSADKNAAAVTLGAVRLIRERLGAHTSLGVSNVSFGLPCRDAVNSTFFALALENGLSAAIMNPYSPSMLYAYHTFRVLHGMDENCAEYIAFSEKTPMADNSAAVLGSNPGTAHTANSGSFPVSAPEDTAKISAHAAPTSSSLPPKGASDGLAEAVKKGLKERAGALTDELLKTCRPLEIVQNEIIPALDIVGREFEAKRFYLPQLLMSAEAAKTAFERIKTAVLADKNGSEETSGKKLCVVLATVHGDIHDIGKNIVKLLMENYGFDVIDLGRDVPAEAVADAAVKYAAPLVGLSALMTTTVPAMEETIKLLRVRAPWCKIMVGGAVLDPEYAERIGADKYCADAMDSVRYAETLCSPGAQR